MIFHGLDELILITVPLSGIERGDLAGIEHPTIWIRSLFQPEGMKFMRSSIGSSLEIPLCFLVPWVEDLSLLAQEQEAGSWRPPCSLVCGLPLSVTL